MGVPVEETRWGNEMKLNIWKFIYLNCGRKYEQVNDHRSYIRNLSSCEKKAWKFFFRLSFRNCLSCVYNCDDHSLVHSLRNGTKWRREVGEKVTAPLPSPPLHPRSPSCKRGCYWRSSIFLWCCLLYYTVRGWKLIKQLVPDPLVLFILLKRSWGLRFVPPYKMVLSFWVMWSKSSNSTFLWAVYYAV